MKNVKEQFMIYLKIDNNKGYYLKNVEGVEVITEIDQICKEDLLYLLKKVINDNFEMDEFKPELLSNKAHMIIYKSLYEKFTELKANKNRFVEESESLYKEALDKYTINNL